MKRALLVIDVQNEYFTGALPITHPAGHLEQILAAMDAVAGKVPTVVPGVVDLVPRRGAVHAPSGFSTAVSSSGMTA